MSGNGGDDILIGNGGNDALDGGVGNDTASYTEDLDVADFSYVSSHIQVATDTEGTDQLSNIELVTDGTNVFRLVGAGGYADNASAVAASALGDIIIDGTADYDSDLAVTVVDTLVNASERTALEFTVAGLDGDATAVVTFTDGGSATVAVNVAAGENGVPYFANLIGLVDGNITVTISATDSGLLTAAGIGDSFALDTTAPLAATTSFIQIADDSGTAGDYITNDASVTVSGVFAGTLNTGAGEKIQVSADGGTTWVDAGIVGSLWIADGVGLVEGPGTLSTRTVDTAGNVNPGVSHAYTLDTAALTPGVELASDTGIDGDNISFVGTVSVTDIEVGAIWQYRTHNGSAWTAWTTGSGSSFTLAEGSYAAGAVEIQQTDVAGNNSTVGSNAEAIVIDQTPPVAPSGLDLAAADDSANDTDNITNVTTALTISVAGENDATLELFDDDNDDGIVDAGESLGYGTVAGGTYSFDVALAEGVHKIKAIQTDVAGNPSPVSTALEITIDTTLATPTVDLTFDSGTDGDLLTNDASLTVSAAAGDVTRMFTVDSGTPASTYDPNALADGTHLVLVTDTDTAGNIQSASITFTLDTTLATPTVTLSADSGINGDNVTNDANLAFSLAAGDVTRMFTVDGGTPASTYDPNALADGLHLVQVTDTDMAGNVQSASITFTLDTFVATPGVALNSDTGSNSSDGITKDAMVNVSGLETGGTWQYSTNNGSSWTIGTGSSFTLAQLPYAAGHIQVKQSDLAGNNSLIANIASAVTVDTTAPSAITSSVTAISEDTGTPGDFITNDGIVDVSGLYNDVVGVGETIQVSANGSAWVNAVPFSSTGGGGIWAAANVALVPGSGTLSTRTIDTAGNITVGANRAYTYNVIYTGTSGPENMLGTDAAEQFFALAGNDSVNGAGGNDTIDGGEGADSMLGGLGDDVYFVDNVSDVVIENAGEGNDTVNSSLTWTLGANQENLTLTGTSAINGTGNSQNNFLIGNQAANILDGKAGADTMWGGDGNDSYYVDNVTDVIMELANQGTDIVYSLVTWTLGANQENLYLFGNNPINGTGNSLANTLYGNNNSAANVLAGSVGNDAYYVGVGDSVHELSGEGNDIVYSTISWTLEDNVERLHLFGSDAINGTGNGLANTLYGNANSAANVLTGGLGNDIYYVGVGDSVSELPGGGNDIVYSTISWTLQPNVEEIYLMGNAAISGTGNDLANVLRTET
nr:Ig-like domain-containing protein [Candidatus Accumulibacter phosphatis]